MTDYKLIHPIGTLVVNKNTKHHYIYLGIDADEKLVPGTIHHYFNFKLNDIFYAYVPFVEEKSKIELFQSLFLPA